MVFRRPPGNRRSFPTTSPAYGGDEFLALMRTSAMCSRPAHRSSVDQRIAAPPGSTGVQPAHGPRGPGHPPVTVTATTNCLATADATVQPQTARRTASCAVHRDVALPARSGAALIERDRVLAPSFSIRIPRSSGRPTPRVRAYAFRFGVHGPRPRRGERFPNERSASFPVRRQARRDLEPVGLAPEAQHRDFHDQR